MKRLECRITGQSYSRTADEQRRHLKALELVARGGLPYAVREAIKDAGWALVKSVKTTDASIEVGKAMICFSYWARARQNGIADERFEEFMQDHFAFVDSQASPVGNAREREDALRLIAKWAQFDT